MLTEQTRSKRLLMIASVIAAVALITGVLGFYAGTWKSGADPSLVPVNWIGSAFVPAIVMIIAVIAVHKMLSQTRESHVAFEGKLDTNSANLISTIRELCRPNMHSLSGTDIVMREATEMIGEATKDRETLWYYGTSNLTGLPGSNANRDEPREMEEIRDQYRSAMTLAHTEQIPIVRFIGLDSAIDFALRLETDQEEYKEWVRHQIHLMERNQNYNLFHSIRAPRMGASTNIISTKDSMILMVGNGTLGLRINGDSIVRPFRDNWTRVFEGRAGKPQEYSAGRLKRYLADELKLPPSIKTLRSAVDLLDELINQFEKVAKSKVGGIVYVGSGGLMACDDIISKDAVDRYERVMHELQDRDIPFVRFICLLEVKDFMDRSEDTKKRYLRWLEKQIQLLREYEKYEFFHAPRAVSWGSTESCIFTPFGYFQVGVNGSRGVHVSGEELAQDRAAATKQAFNDAFKKPEKYTENRLQKHFDELHAVMAGKPKPSSGERTKRMKP